MSLAENIVSGGEIPLDWSAGAEEVKEACKEAYARLYEAQQAMADGEDHPDAVLATVHENHGLHAYRYEVCDDGSVVALWANTKTGNVKMKAFASLEQASGWSPRDEG